jgi:ferrochelatase
MTMNDTPLTPTTIEPAEPIAPPAIPAEAESLAVAPALGVAPAVPEPTPVDVANVVSGAEPAARMELPLQPAEVHAEQKPQQAPVVSETHSDTSAVENLPLVTAPAVAAGAPTEQPATAPTATPATEPVVGGIGVLLVNLGTPDLPDAASVRRYLSQFLTDPRVIENDTLIWKLVLNGIILPLRSRVKARDYRRIWNKAKDESPLKTITRSQAEKLADVLTPLGKHVIVDWAMRYASPSIPSRLAALVARGCERILIMPLYPQYAAPTTATVNDEVFRYLMTLRKQPAIRILPPYYDDPYYIEVLASSLKAELKALPFAPDVIVASFHGMPREYVDKGDPYESQCLRTTQLLRAQLKLDKDKLMLTYQSRFGRAQWLEPYTLPTVKALAKKGVKNLVVITPGFSADCLETLEEIAVENAHVFKRYGGENFVAIPCLNDSQAGMLMIWQLAMRELKGWV